MITIPGIPNVLKRHRHKKSGGTYNSQRTEMNNLGFIVKTQWTSDPIDYIIKLEVVFYINMPKSFSNKKVKEFENRYDGRHHDLSNYIKFLEDSLNGIVWRDDSLIVELNAKKKYSSNPRTEFEIKQL